MQKVVLGFLSVDPLAGDYAAWSPYNYVMGNPIRFIDPDGRSVEDIVYFNRKGEEIYRIKSETIFETYVARDDGMTTIAASRLSEFYGGPVHDRFFDQAPMPNIIQNRASGGVSTTGEIYQEHDYTIAAQTELFNQALETGSLSLFTDGGHSIPSSALSDISLLDPTLVKAVAMQETSLGQTISDFDIMESNNIGDWGDYKANYGLSYGNSPGTVSESVYAGIRVLATKGYRGGVNYDTKTGVQTFSFQGWESAIQEYNGGGAPGYQENVLRMINESSQRQSPRP